MIEPVRDVCLSWSSRPCIAGPVRLTLHLPLGRFRHLAALREHLVHPALSRASLAKAYAVEEPFRPPSEPGPYRFSHGAEPARPAPPPWQPWPAAPAYASETPRWWPSSEFPPIKPPVEIKEVVRERRLPVPVLRPVTGSLLDVFA